MKKQIKKELLWFCGLSALAFFATRRPRAALVPLLAGSVVALQKSQVDSFEGQSVFITGGSRGLGFALAQSLVQEGANVTLVARDMNELTKAQELLSQLKGGKVHTIACDVTVPSDLKRAMSEANSKFNGIDLLINNAGAILVGPWETLEPEDFEAQIKLHVYAPMEAIRCVLPYLRQTTSGKRIVNICSMGGRVAVPHMLAYDTSKFALSGFSQGIGVELASEGISVTTVYPSLLRTGSPIQAVFKGDHEKEFAWFQAGDILPGLSMSASSAARRIVEAARDRRWELTLSKFAQLRMGVAAFFPELMNQLMVGFNRLLPTGQSRVYKTGAQSRELFDKSLLTKGLVQRAHETEKQLNQEPKTDPRYNMGLH